MNDSGDVDSRSGIGLDQDQFLTNIIISIAWGSTGTIEPRSVAVKNRKKVSTGIRRALRGHHTEFSAVRSKNHSVAGSLRT